MSGSSLRIHLVVILTFVALAGCTPVPPGSATSGAVRVSKSGGVCETLRTELRDFERRGVPYQAEALRSGNGRLSDEQRATIKRYEGVLDEYLHRNCHAKQSP